MIRSLLPFALALSVSVSYAQTVVLPTVELPRVEMPRIDMPHVHMPGSVPVRGNLHGQGQLYQSDGSPAGRWKTGVISGRIQMQSDNGAPIGELVRSAAGRDIWVPSDHSNGLVRWQMDPATGALRRLP